MWAFIYFVGDQVYITHKHSGGQLIPDQYIFLKLLKVNCTNRER